MKQNALNFRNTPKIQTRLACAVLIAVGFFAKSSVTSADDPASTLRGYTEVDRIIHERIARTNGFELGQYLGNGSTQPAVGSLLALLGTYVGSSTDADYRNGDPNSVNTLLWYIALSQFAQDISNQCAAAKTTPISATPSPSPVSKPSGAPVATAEVLADASPSPSPSPSASPPPPALALRPEFQTALLPLCQWPAASAKTDDALYNYYSALMSFDAPPEEFAAWKDYFLNDPDFANASASVTVPAMTLAALFNPYFLLKN